MKKINLLIVDDRDIIRDAIKILLSKFSEIIINSEAIDGEQAFEMIEDSPNRFDIILMDINLPKMDGMMATKKIKELNSNVKIIAFSLHKSAGYIVDMIRCGASGYVIKDESAETYFEAITTVFNGGVYLTDKIDSTEYDKTSSLLRKMAS